MSLESSAWYCLFSPTLEDAIMYSSKDGTIPKSIVTKLTEEESEALAMWNYKQHGIFPNQYHYSYNDGDTIIYPEHLRDIVIIDKIMTNKLLKEQKEEQERQKQKQKKSSLGTSGGKTGGSGFYGHTFKFNSS